MSSIYEGVIMRLLNESLSRSTVGIRPFSPQGPIKGSRVLCCTAYDLSSLKSPAIDTSDAESLSDTLSSSIVAAITIRKPRSGCNGAWEVTAIAGPGQGKLAYNMGYWLAPSKKLFPDRESLSYDAQLAWKGYASKSPGTPLTNCQLWKHVPDAPNNPAVKGEMPDLDTVNAVNSSYSSVDSPYDFETMKWAFDDYVDSLFAPRGKLDRHSDMGSLVLAMNVAHSEYLTPQRLSGT